MHTFALATCALASLGSVAWAAPRENFLKSGLVAEADVKTLLRSELVGHAAGARAVSIRESLQTMFTALPKNSHGKLDHQAVRYALHRFFVHQNGWFIRGLEPNNDTWHGAPNPDAHNSSSMKEWVPSYLQDILEQQLGRAGTDLPQLSAVAAALEDLIQREVLGRLEATYRMHGLPEDKLVNAEVAGNIIKTYYVGFLVASDFTVGSVRELEYKKNEFTSQYVGWPEAEQWLLELSKKYLQTSDSMSGFSFQDVERFVSKIGQEYFKFNDKECGDLKQTLSGMQGKKPGRVRLSTFYSKGMYTHWHFSEKVDYLKAIGALDDSDPKQPFVIIANYAMARPNCLDSSNLYTICCRNECEDLMSRLESEIEDATATPGRIADLVAVLSSPSIAAPRNLSAGLLSRLSDVAGLHGGQVPMHGRLFAQWMHHAYPMECPYPHELGAVNPQTPDEWMKETGHKSESASTEEMMEHVARDSCAVDAQGRPDCVDETEELPWSDSEELLTWHPRDADKLAVATESQPGLASVLLEAALAFTGLVVAFGLVRQHAERVGRDDNGKVKRGLSGMLVPLATLGLVGLAAYFQGLLDGWLFLCVLACGGVVAAANRRAHGQRHRRDVQSKRCDV